MTSQTFLLSKSSNNRPLFHNNDNSHGLVVNGLLLPKSELLRHLLAQRPLFHLFPSLGAIPRRRRPRGIAKIRFPIPSLAGRARLKISRDLFRCNCEVKRSNNAWHKPSGMGPAKLAQLASLPLFFSSLDRVSARTGGGAGGEVHSGKRRRWVGRKSDGCISRRTPRPLS